MAVVLTPALADESLVDHPCTVPAFPADCVERLGRIGGPPSMPAGEGWLHIVSPVVNPLLRLRSNTTDDGLLYAVNPQANRVRVLDPRDGLSVRRDIDVCYRPSALAQSPDGSEVYVSCHASDAVAVIDTARQRMVAEIQDRDAEARPLLQEPLGIVATADRIYVASSQNNRLAVIDRSSRRVLRYVELPGQDPRSMALLPEGRHLVVANFAAGNRTEPAVQLNPAVFDPKTAAGAICAPLLEDRSARAVALEGGPGFMDTSHPDYATIAECYFFAHAFGTSNSVVVNPGRSDHDLVVVDLTAERVVFSTDALQQDPGTLNYGVAVDPATSRVYLVSTEARNALNSGFGDRPLVNRLGVFDFDAASGRLSPIARHDLDALGDAERVSCGGTADRGASCAAIPYAVTVSGTRVLIAAAGSDALLVADREGIVGAALPTGYTPKGLVDDGETVHVYNATGLSVTSIDVTSGATVATASLGASPVPHAVRIGARLFHSAEFARNGTFACASCHPDGHLDGLVWKLNDRDGLRATMSLLEISETAPYHWDGSKCNLVKNLQDTIVNLFHDPHGPSECEMATMIEYIEGLVRPHSPFRPLDDRLSSEAARGLSVLGRSRSKDLDDTPRVCTTRIQDMAAERFILEAFGDPRGEVFRFNGGGGPVANTRVTESCSIANCHVAPYWESDGFLDGDPSRERIDGFQAVSTLGAWDRMTTSHDARTTRAALLEALEVNRAFHGAPAAATADHYTGTLATRAFNDTHFRHVEYNFDADPTTHGFVLTDALTRFMQEDEQLQTGTVGLTVVLAPERVRDPTTADLRSRLRVAADQYKIVYRGVGLLGGAMRSLTWQPGQGLFRSGNGESLTPSELEAALAPGDAMVLYGGLLPGQDTSVQPKLRAVARERAPYLCSENHDAYHGDVTVGEVGAQLTLHAADVAPKTRVLVDGRVEGAALTGHGPTYPWVLPRAPDRPAILTLQLLGPTGLQSNPVAVHVVPPVVAPREPRGITADKTRPTTARLSWPNQFGITGPGTRYDVYRGLLGDPDTAGLGGGRCVGAALFRPQTVDGQQPGPGEAFYYVVRAQNQVGVSSWGSASRDAAIAVSNEPCPLLFPPVSD